MTFVRMPPKKGTLLARDAGIIAYELKKLQSAECKSRAKASCQQAMKARQFLYYSPATEEWRIGANLPASPLEAAVMSPYHGLKYTMSVSSLEVYPVSIGAAKWHRYNPQKRKWDFVTLRVKCAH